jgi:Holliday junction DNA helicase RuvA
MITFLEGSVVEKQPTRVVLNVAGVGYEVMIPLSSFDRLPALRETCHIRIHDHVREDQHVLYGFMTEAERRTFLLLLNVSGIGPKTALGALSGMSVRDLTAAIVAGDIKRICATPGIGKKTAERMVVELRDKISDGEALEAIAGSPDEPLDARTRDAVLALISLGYKQNEAHKMVHDVLARQPADATLETVVRLALARAS